MRSVLTLNGQKPGMLKLHGRDSPAETVLLKCHRRFSRETHKVNGSLINRAQVLPRPPTDFSSKKRIFPITSLKKRR